MDTSNTLIANVNTNKSGLSVPPKGATDKVLIERWDEVITNTETWRDDQSRNKGWKRAENEFKGDWSHLQKDVSIPIIPLNLVFAYVKTEVSRLYFKDPWITANAKRVEDIGSARIAEQLLNYTWSEIDLKRQVKLAIQDALIVGHGWIKSGYTCEIGQKEATVEAKDAPKRGPGRPPKKDNKPDLDTSEYVKSEDVFAYHMPWKNVAFEPSTQWPAPDNARWMSFTTVKPLEVVKSCGMYENLAGLKGTGLTDEERKNHKEGTWVVLREIWDRDKRLVYTGAKGHDKWLKEPFEWPYKHDGFPASMLSFNPLTDEPYPLSDVLMQEPQIIQMMKFMAIMENHLKRWNRQLFAKKGFMDPVEFDKYKKGIDGAIIETNLDPTQQNFNPSPYAPVQQDIYGIWNLVADTWRNVAGQSEVERGAAPRSQTRTLGELRLALQGSRGRADEKIDTVEMFIEDIARKLLSIMQQKFTLPKIVRIVGPKAIEKAFVINRPSAQGQGQQGAYTQMIGEDVQAFSTMRDDIHGEMDVDVIAGSTIPLDKENQLQVMEKLVPNLELLGIKPGSRAAREYGREYLRQVNVVSLDRIMDIADEEAQNPTPDPEEMKAKAEIEKTQMDAQMKQQQGQQKMAANQQKTQLQIQSMQAKSQSQAQEAQIKVASQMKIAEIEVEKEKKMFEMDIVSKLLDQQRKATDARNGNSQKE